MTKVAIVAAIDTVALTSGSYGIWQIGITNDPDARKAEWGKTKSVMSWITWVADSLSDAQAIEAHFIHDKGMKGGTGGGTLAVRTTYVYIF